MRLRFALTLSAAAVLWLAAAGCSGGDDPPAPRSSVAASSGSSAGASPGGTGTQEPTASPLPEGFIDFAGSVNEAVRGGDGDFFRDRMRTEHLVCTQEDMSPRGPGGPSCTTAGEELDVIPSGVWLADSAAVEPDAAVMIIAALWRDEATSEEDEYGEAEARVYALGRWDDPEFGETYVTFVTALIAPGPVLSEELRVVFALLWQASGDYFELVRILQTRSMPWLFLDPERLDVTYLRQWERFTP